MTKFKMYSLDPVTPYILLRHSKWINSMYLPGRLLKDFAWFFSETSSESYNVYFIQDTLFIQKYKNIIQTMGIAILCFSSYKIIPRGLINN